MDAERWKRVDVLLQAALRVPAGQQEEFLRQQCGGDSELLEEVRSVLTSHRKAGGFLESPGQFDHWTICEMSSSQKGLTGQGRQQNSEPEEQKKDGQGQDEEDNEQQDRQRRAS